MLSRYYFIFKFIENYINIFIYYFTYRKQLQSKPDRLLISKLDHIGDFILFSSSLRIYRELFPTTHITLLVQDCTYNIAELCPYVDDIWQINQRNFRRNPLSRIRWALKIKNGNFDTAINTVFSVSVSFLDCLVGFSHAKRRIGFASGELDSVRKKPYYNELVSDTQNTLFEIDRNFILLNYLGYKGSISRSPELWLNKEDLNFANNLCSDLRFINYGILFPGSRQPFKIWPSNKFCSVLNIIKDCIPIQWIVCGSNSEAELCSTIANQLQNNGISSYNLAGKTSVRELAAMIKGAAVYLGNDTMAVHLAAAFNVPSVCVMGGGQFGRFYPYPENPSTQAVIYDLPCFGCNWVCTRNEVECIYSISVDKVVAALFSVLSRSSETSHYTMRQ